MLGRRIAAFVALIAMLGGGAAASAAANTATSTTNADRAPIATKSIARPSTASTASSASMAAAASVTATATVGSSVGFNGEQAMYLDGASLDRELDGVAATGSHWLRVDFPWAALEGAGRGQYSWAPADRLVAAANARGIRLLALVAYTPTWDRPAGTTDHYQPTDPTAYAEFVAAAAQRYAPLGVHNWEIWNEPNMRDFWAPQPDVARYTQLLRLGSAAIHSVDHSAFVVSAGLSPALDVAGYSVAPNEFVAGIYSNGGGPYLQAVGMHPYSFPYAPMYPASWNTFYMMSATHSIMAAHGDGAKAIWGTEIGWGTGTGSQAVSEAEQSAMAAQAVSAWNSLPFTGNLFWYDWKDINADRSNVWDNMGVLRSDGSAKPALATFTSLLHGASSHVVGGSANGPWLVGSDARLFSTGGMAVPARGGLALNEPITGSARTPDARGVWTVGGDGGIFTFGNARFYGSTGAMHLNRPIAGMTATPSGRGYWLVASDGGVFSFGDARFYGSTGAIHLNRPIVGIAMSHLGHGYWMVASDGGMFSFGDAKFYGSAAGNVSSSIVGVATTPAGHGYWLAEVNGAVHSYGDAGYANPVNGANIVDLITP
jgi:hypothetical protein